MKRTSKTAAGMRACAAPDGRLPAVAEPDLTLTAYDALADSQRFDEPVRGMQVRELRVPGLFKRFFGLTGAAGVP